MIAVDGTPQVTDFGVVVSTLGQSDSTAPPSDDRCSFLSLPAPLSHPQPPFSALRRCMPRHLGAGCAFLPRLCCNLGLPLGQRQPSACTAAGGVGSPPFVGVIRKKRSHAKKHPVRAAVQKLMRCRVAHANSCNGE